MKLAIIFIAALFSSTHVFADKWDYSTDVDKMTGKQSSTASITATKQLSLGFPYNGSNYGFLTIRKHPQHGLDVIVTISKGQILCPSYNGCTVKVRFGEGQPINFSAAGPADNSSNTVFLRNAQKFIEQAKKNSSIKIQLNIYQAGGEVLEFDSPSPLVWGAVPTKKPKA
jgi:hypothetical protein